MAYYQPVVVAEPRSSTAHIVIAWVLAVVTAFYLLPWAIAATRSHPSTVTIALLNVFLGWTGVGWLATLIWACISPSRPAMIVSGVAVTPMVPSYHVAALPPGGAYSASTVSAYPVSGPSAAYPSGPTSYPVSAVTAYPVSGPSAGYPAYDSFTPSTERYSSTYPGSEPGTATTFYPTSASTADLTWTQMLPGEPPLTQPLSTQPLPTQPLPTQPLPGDQDWPLADWQHPDPDSPCGFHG